MVLEVIEWTQGLVYVLDVLVPHSVHDVLIVCKCKAVVNFCDVRVKALPEVYLDIFHCLRPLFHDDLRRWKI